MQRATGIVPTVLGLEQKVKLLLATVR